MVQQFLDKVLISVSGWLNPVIAKHTRITNRTHKRHPEIKHSLCFHALILADPSHVEATHLHHLPTIQVCHIFYCMPMDFWFFNFFKFLLTLIYFIIIFFFFFFFFLQIFYKNSFFLSKLVVWISIRAGQICHSLN